MRIPDLMARACDAQSQRTGAMYLSLAEAWVKKGQSAQAQACLEKAIQAAPGSRHAEQVKRLGKCRFASAPGRCQACGLRFRPRVMIIAPVEQGDQETGVNEHVFGHNR